MPQLLPVIKPAEFAQRRKQLMRMMCTGANERCVAIIPAAHEQKRNRDVHYPFRQDSDFYYLTGFAEPDALLVLAPNREAGEVLLFVRPKDPQKEQWDGYRAGVDGAIQDYAADVAFELDDIDEQMPALLDGVDKVFYTMGLHADFDQQMFRWVNSLRAGTRAGAKPPQEFVVLDNLLHDLRLYKSKAEIKVMQASANLAAEAHCRAMRLTQPGVMEYQVEAEIAQYFRRHNTVEAYQSIVGGGVNACILHYIENNAELHDGDLLLIDAGCEVDYYASDITRTFPVNGKFSSDQAAIYQIVLDAQLAAIEQVRENHDWDAPHRAAVRVITTGLVALGILAGDVDKLVEEAAYRPYYMHRTGHWLGMDVHDVGDYKVDEQWRCLEAGMVTTIEPGIYIQAGSDCDERWWNIGVRIEDDVVVTSGEPEVLTSAVPKTIADIEALMRAGRMQESMIRKA